MIKSITTTLTNNLTFSLIWTNCINTKTKNYTPNFTQKYFFHLFSLLRSTQKLWLGLAQISNPDFQRICRKPNVNLITFFTYNELNVWLTLGPLRSPSGQQFNISRSYSSSYTQKQSPKGVPQKNCFLKNFAKFVGRHLYWSLFFNKPDIIQGGSFFHIYLKSSLFSGIHGDICFLHSISVFFVNMSQ